MTVAVEQIMEMLGSKTNGEEIFAGTVLEPAANALLDWTKTLQDGNRSVMVARMPYDMVWAR